uniref:Uncharacterized protein n=1 Tax=Oryza barthii TaxID=65489 RepID=A0A0D3GBR1_9ORYZ
MAMTPRFSMADDSGGEPRSYPQATVAPLFLPLFCRLGSPAMLLNDSIILLREQRDDGDDCS